MVEEHIERAEPVSSRSALARSGLGVSPATVRSAMAELEDAGLLAQPHASAGRVPTDAAFRMYVDALLRDPLERGVERTAERGGEGGASLPALDGDAVDGLDGVLRRAAALLSRETGQLGFSFARGGQCARLRQLRFVRVSSDRVMALLLYASGTVCSRVFRESDSPQRVLDEASARLSDWVCGLTLLELRARLESELGIDRARRDRAWRQALALARAGTAGRDEVELPFYLGDRASLLRHPEFGDVTHLGEILQALEEKERMLGLLDPILSPRSLRVVIGDELADPQMRRCAVVTAPFDAGACGGIGVIGPVRMRYDRVIPVVRSLSEHMADHLASVA